MRAPEFWRGRGALSTLLWPVGAVLGRLTAARAARAPSWDAPVPVICVGNVTAGGTGKTPTALALAHLLAAWHVQPHFLSRGYRGKLDGPVRVDPARHSHRDVGDEPLLLARAAPTWVAKDRVAGAKAAVEAGAQAIIMDDGLQNPSLAKDLSLIVVDGGYGFGNGRLLPAGPLREPLATAKRRAQAALIIGRDRFSAARKLAPLPVLSAHVVPDIAAESLRGQRVVATAGIGRPEKFFETLVELGAQLVEAIPFPDHHDFTPDDIMLVCDIAAERDAIAVTTEKDHVRLPADAQAMLTPVSVRLEWQDEDAIRYFIDRLF